MREQTAETQISLDIDTIRSESLLSAWTNVQADLESVGLANHFAGLDLINWT